VLTADRAAAGAPSQYGHAAHFDHEEEHAHGGKEEAEEHHH
jgi:hypothetical protein